MAPRTLLLAAALLAAACDRGAGEPREQPAEERAADPRTSGRRGDRHQRAAARTAPAVKRVEGTLARAGEKQVVIRLPGEPEMTLRVAAGTTVTLNGRPARLDHLQPGAEIRAAYQTGQGGRPTAISIEARSPGKKDPAPPRAAAGGRPGGR